MTVCAAEPIAVPRWMQTWAGVPLRPSDTDRRHPICPSELSEGGDVAADIAVRCAPLLPLVRRGCPTHGHCAPRMPV
jgi:hypothetical protein